MDVITPLLSLDLGKKRTGVALVNRLGLMTPLPRLVIEGPFQASLKKQLDQLFDDYRPKALLIGLPIQPNGTFSEQTEWVKTHGEWLASIYHVPVYWENEVLTSVEAHARLHELGIPMKKHTLYVDSVAALILAESFLRNKNIVF